MFDRDLPPVKLLSNRERTFRTRMQVGLVVVCALAGFALGFALARVGG